MPASSLFRNLLSPARPRIAALALAGLAGLPATTPVLASGARAVPDAGGAVEPGTGMLVASSSSGRQPLPMLDLQVELDIAGLMAHGTVIQAFENPTVETLEAVYVFPLPERAAVHHMEIRIGERRIVSIIQERQEARRTYERARQEGRRAALLEQQRPNLFTTAVHGIGPGEQVQVRLEVVEELEIRDGAFELIFPLTYTPRYRGPLAKAEPLPGERSAGEAAGSDELSDPSSQNGGTGPVAAPPRARVRVTIAAGLPLEVPESDTHALARWWDGGLQVVQAVSSGRQPAAATGRAPAPGDPEGMRVAADRDFHLRLRPLAGHEPSTALLLEDRPDGRYGLLMILPPSGPGAAVGLPTETLFIIDVSGSMAGPSIVQAKTALLAALDRLHPDDAFNILAFNEKVRSFAPGYLPAGFPELAQARRWVVSLRADGGTRIDRALAAGLHMAGQDDTWKAERIVFLTDGAVGAEEAVIGMVRSRLGTVRLHALGIGAAPNRYLMRKMAAAGRGLCEFIPDAGLAENRIDRFLRRLDRPVMTDVDLQWPDIAPLESYPSRLPDLHAGEPLVMSLRLPDGGEPDRVILTGRMAGGEVRREIPIAPVSERPSGVAVRWARARVVDLLDSLHAGADRETVRGAVIDLARRFGLVTRFTSLVAVEETPGAGGEVVRVRVPAAFPGQGVLPAGGTADPLLRLAAGLCALAAAVAALVCRMVRRRAAGHSP